MSLDDIDNYLNQIKEFGNYIYLHVLGEPLLHPNFDQILKLLDEKDFNLQLVTNGILLNKNPNLLKHLTNSLWYLFISSSGDLLISFALFKIGDP